MRKIYHLSTCSTNKRILKEIAPLDGVELHEIKEYPISETQLDEMKELAGSYESLFSKRARKYKELGLKDMKLNDADYKKYILSDYTFLARPVAIIDGEVFVGNSKKNVEALKQKLQIG
ncbi:MAG: arsenate reductase [Flavobacteriales bacterium]|nr:arsenate reductase [Flavobacteriales bacterium]